MAAGPAAEAQVLVAAGPAAEAQVLVAAGPAAEAQVLVAAGPAAEAVAQLNAAAESSVDFRDVRSAPASTSAPALASQPATAPLTSQPTTAAASQVLEATGTAAFTTASCIEACSAPTPISSAPTPTPHSTPDQQQHRVASAHLPHVPAAAAAASADPHSSLQVFRSHSSPDQVVADIDASSLPAWQTAVLRHGSADTEHTGATTAEQPLPWQRPMLRRCRSRPDVLQDPMVSEEVQRSSASLCCLTAVGDNPERSPNAAAAPFRSSRLRLLQPAGMAVPVSGCYSLRYGHKLPAVAHACHTCGYRGCHHLDTRSDI